MQGPPPTSVIQQSPKLDAGNCLPLSEQFEVIQNQARQEATAERSEFLKQTVSLTIPTVSLLGGCSMKYPDKNENEWFHERPVSNK